MPNTSFLAEIVKAGSNPAKNNPYVQDFNNTDSVRIVQGTGTLVTGALTIATGLTAITFAVAIPTSQPTGTGTASNQLLVPTWATGALTVTAYSVSSATGGTAAASTATGTFAYLAYGT